MTVPFQHRMSITKAVQMIRDVYIHRGGAIRLIGPVGASKSSQIIAEALKMQEADPDFGACYINFSGTQSVDYTGWPLSGNGLLAASSVPTLFQSVPHLGLRGAFPAICPPRLASHRSSFHSLPSAEITLEKLHPYPRGMFIGDEASKVMTEGDMASLAMLAYEGRTGLWGVPPSWLRVFIANRQEDRSGDLPFPATFDNRVRDIHITSGFEDVAPYWRSTGMHPWFLSFAERYPSLVLRDAVPLGGGQFGTARSWFEAHADCMKYMEKVVQVPHDATRPNWPSYCPDDVSMNAVFDVTDQDPELVEWRNDLIGCIASWCGPEVAGQFSDYVAHMGERPSYDEIVADPNNAVLSSHPGVQHYMVAMILEHIKLTDLDNIVLYVQRMPASMRAIFCTKLLEEMPFAVSKSARFVAMMNDVGDGGRFALTTSRS